MYVLLILIHTVDKFNKICANPKFSDGCQNKNLH
jgi:hypothetical protein